MKIKGLILRPYQMDIVQTIEENLSNNKKHQIVYMPNGTGKTILLAFLAERFSQRNMQVMIYCSCRNTREYIQNELLDSKHIVVSSLSDIKKFQKIKFDYILLENPFMGLDDNTVKSLDKTLNKLDVNKIESNLSKQSSAQLVLLGLYYLREISNYGNSSSIRFNSQNTRTQTNFDDIDISYFPVIETNYWTTLPYTSKCTYEIQKLQDILEENSYSSDSKEFECIKQMMEDLSKNVREIKQTVNEINNKLQDISENISHCQSLTKRLLLITEDELEKEKLLSTFVDECVEKITLILDNHENKEKDSLKELVSELGESAWKKLAYNSQRFLLTSTLIYKGNYPNENFDYSTVCLPIIKTLECELKQRFFFDFCSYLSTRYDVKDFPTALLFMNEKIKKDTSFTLGSFAYLFGIKNENGVSFDRKQKDRETLLKYCCEEIFENSNPNEISRLLADYAKQIDDIKSQYRDKFAHTGLLKMAEAKSCRDWIIYSKKLLKQLLDSFKY